MQAVAPVPSRNHLVSEDEPGWHVLLDELTHVGRWGHQHISWLSQTYAGLAGAQWLQYAAGVAGLVMLGLMIAWSLCRAEPHPRVVRSPGGRTAVVAGVLIGGIVAMIDAAMLAVTTPGTALFMLATRGMLAVAAGLLVGAVVWAVLVRRADREPRTLTTHA